MYSTLPHTSLDIYLSVQVSRALSFILGRDCSGSVQLVFWTSPPRACVYEAVSQSARVSNAAAID